MVGNVILIVLAVLCVLFGILGAVVPGLPGPPVSWVGLLLLGLSSCADYSVAFLLVMAVLAALITVFDYVVPSLTTKKLGGSKWGIWGCNIGLVISIVGLPFGPQGLLGVVIWPFLGAFVGELLTHKPAKIALKAAFGAFLGFLTGTLVKLVYCLVAAFFVVKDLIV